MACAPYFTPNLEVVRHLVGLGIEDDAINLATLWANIGYWSQKGRFSPVAFQRTWGVSQENCRKYLYLLYAIGAIDECGEDDWLDIRVNQPPFTIEQRSDKAYRQFSQVLHITLELEAREAAKVAG